MAQQLQDFPYSNYNICIFCYCHKEITKKAVSKMNGLKQRRRLVGRKFEWQWTPHHWKPIKVTILLGDCGLKEKAHTAVIGGISGVKGTHIPCPEYITKNSTAEVNVLINSYSCWCAHYRAWCWSFSILDPLAMRNKIEIILLKCLKGMPSEIDIFFEQETRYFILFLNDPTVL